MTAEPFSGFQDKRLERHWTALLLESLLSDSNGSVPIPRRRVCQSSASHAGNQCSRATSGKMTPRVIAGLSVMPHTLAFLHGLTFRVRFFLPRVRLLSASNHHRLTQRRSVTAGRPQTKT